MLDRHKFKKCYFCDRNIVSKDIILDIDAIKEIKRTLGDIPEREAGKIGNKYICKCCLDDLKSLIE
jgi:hypothetical protein